MGVSVKILCCLWGSSFSHKYIGEHALKQASDMVFWRELLKAVRFSSSLREVLILL